MSHIGKAIAWGRKSIGLTQSDFAKHMQCHRSWLYRVEVGTHCPSHDFVENCAKMFGFRNVEQMKSGCLATRLSALTEAQQKQIRKLLRKLPNFEQELTLATSGVRMPSDDVLAVLAKHFTDGSIDDLLYGDLPSPVEKIETA